MPYNHVIISSEIKLPMPVDIWAYETVDAPDSVGGGTVSRIGFQTTFRSVAIWKFNNKPLCIDIWFAPVLDMEKKPHPDMELELNWPMPTEHHCWLIALLLMKADDIKSVTEKDIPNTAYSKDFPPPK